VTAKNAECISSIVFWDESFDANQSVFTFCIEGESFFTGQGG